MASIRWSQEIFNTLDLININIRQKDEKNYKNIISNYYNILDYVLTDIFTQGISYLEPEQQIDITQFILDNYSHKNSAGDFISKGKFLDLTLGPKIAVFNHFKLFKNFKNLELNEDTFEEIQEYFKSIEQQLILRNKGDQHAASNPYELIADKINIDEVKVKNVDLIFTKFLKELNIKFTPSSFHIISNIPSQGCREFIGRIDLKRQILDELNKDTIRALNIHAFGGYGKTELAKQIAYDLVDNNKDFDAIIWTSAKIDEFDAINSSEKGTIMPINEKKINNFEDIINILLINVLKEYEEDINSYDITTKRKKFERLLTEKKIIIILDNFETIEKDPETKNFIKNLQNVSNNLKLLITSRHELSEIYIKNILLQPFSKKEVKEFLKSEYDNQGIPFDISDELLSKIKNKSFGHPFALQFMTRWLIKGVFDEKNIDKVIINAINSTQIGEFCFKKDYLSLKETSRLLLCIAVHKGDDLNEEELRFLAHKIINISEIDFSKEWHILAQYNFVKRINSTGSITVPDMVKHYVKIELAQESIFSKKYNGKIKLTQAIGEAYKDIAKKSSDWSTWMELCNKIHLVLNKENISSEYYDVMANLEKWEEYKNNDPIYHYYLALLYEKNFDYKNAIVHIDNAITISPDTIQYRLCCADIFVDCGDFGKAMLTLHKALEDGLYEIEIIRKICDISPSLENFELIFNQYYTGKPNIGISNQFKIRLTLWRSLLYKIYNFVHENVNSKYTYSFPLEERLEKIKKYLRDFENFVNDNTENIFNNWLITNVEQEIRIIRDMAKIYRSSVANLTKSSEFVDWANTIQEKYKKTGIFGGAPVMTQQKFDDIFYG